MVDPHTMPRREPWMPRAGRLTGLQLLLGLGVFFIAQTAMYAVAFLFTSLGEIAEQMLEPGGVEIDPAQWVQTFFDDVDPAGLLLGSVIGAAIAVGGYLLVVGPVGRRHGQGLAGPGKLAEFTAGLGLGTVLIALPFGILMLAGAYQVSGINPEPELLVPLAVGIGAGFMEEVLFRGILMRLLDSWFGSWWALALSAVLFGGVHLSNPGATLADAVILMVEAGLLLGAAYLLTRRLWLAFGIHIAWNTVQAGVFSSDVSGTGSQAGILDAEFLGPEWLTGGSMGIEGSIVTGVVGAAAGVVMLYLAHRRGTLLPASRSPHRTTDGVSRRGREPNARP